MRILETKIHGYLDYIVGVALILLPIVAGWNLDSAASVIPMVLGLAAIGYSFFTDYELGVSPMISMKTHLTLDFMSGVFLALSPWIFRFANEVWAPHLIVGLFEIGASLITKMKPHKQLSHTVM